jgi:hypothetical protein
MHIAAPHAKYDQAASNVLAVEGEFKQEAHVNIRGPTDITPDRGYITDILSPYNRIDHLDCIHKGSQSYSNQ